MSAWWVVAGALRVPTAETFRAFEDISDSYRFLVDDGYDGRGKSGGTQMVWGVRYNDAFVCDYFAQNQDDVSADECYDGDFVPLERGVPHGGYGEGDYDFFL